VSGPAQVGVDIELESPEPLHLTLFGEGPSRVVTSVRPEAARQFERLMDEFGINWRWIGRVGGDRLVIRTGGASVINLSLATSAQAWRRGFARYVS
jgi:hypothetical protein